MKTFDSIAIKIVWYAILAYVVYTAFINLHWTVGCFLALIYIRMELVDYTTKKLTVLVTEYADDQKNTKERIIREARAVAGSEAINVVHRELDRKDLKGNTSTTA